MSADYESEITKVQLCRGRLGIRTDLTLGGARNTRLIISLDFHCPTADVDWYLLQTVQKRNFDGRVSGTEDIAE